MATVAEVSAPYENFLIPVLKPGEKVCSVCKTAILPDWKTCYQCNQQRLILTHTADVVAPIALAVKQEQWTHELSSYKNSPNAAARQTLSIGLSAVLWRWLDIHEECLVREAAVEAFPLVTAIPSTQGRTSHPLIKMLSEIVKPTATRYEDLLVATWPALR